MSDPNSIRRLMTEVVVILNHPGFRGDSSSRVRPVREALDEPAGAPEADVRRTIAGSHRGGIGAIKAALRA